MAAHVANVVPSRRCTSLQCGDVRVQTVEHVLSALSAMGIDNVLVEVDGEEPPMADGSAAVFVEMIQDAGIVQQPVLRRILELREPVYVRDGDRSLVAIPDTVFRVSFAFLSDHPVIGNQCAEYVVTPETYKDRVASARTIALLHEVGALQRDGLGLGGNLDAVVVLSDTEVISPLRMPDEVVRHKILDLIGDMSLVGPLRAHVIAIRSGHQLHVELARRIWDFCGPNAVSAGQVCAKGHSDR